jgi:2-polyprenyl-3-methyl-5-hydroxy-6-metoxy-1,4-benzoquinol methylase
MKQEILKDIECKVCKNHDENKFMPKYYKNEVNIVQCSECGFVFIPPFYRKQINYKEYKNKDSLKAVIAGNDWLKIQRHKLRYRTIQKYCPKGKLFDLGVGWGHFLHTGRLLGYTVEGIEMAEMPYTYAKEYLKLPVENIDFFDYIPKTNYYDMLTMWDVLEHIDNCDEAIEKCVTMLKQGGHIVIQVPQIDSYIAKTQKERWQAMGLDHVNYFSKDTITRLLESKGFKVIKIKSSIEVKLFLMYSFYDKKRKKQGNPNATQAERQEYFNKKVSRPKWQLKIAVWGHNIVYNLLSLLNIGDEMVVIAKKK